MAVRITINAPSTVGPGQPFLIYGLVWDSIDGSPYVGLTVYIYQEGLQIGSAITNIDGYYEMTHNISAVGTYLLEAAPPGGPWAETYVTVETAPTYSTVTVYLNPPLDGALLQLRLRWLLSEPMDITVAETLSVNGVGFFSGEGYPPGNAYDVRFPPQTIGGVSYLEARTGGFGFDTRQHEFDLYLDVEIPTALTIVAPPTARRGETFRTTGTLIRLDNNQPLPLEAITLWYNNTFIGSGITASDGTYSIDGAIDAFGTLILTAEYAGRSGVARSRAVAALFSEALKYL